MSINEPVKPRRKPDQRAQKTLQRLGSAMVELMLEKPMTEVSLQEVLDRASVGRSTFYLHFRDKDDLLLSQFEQFLEFMSTTLSVRKEESNRIVPVAEIFEHIGSQTKVYHSLADSGHLADFFDLAQTYFARGIECRIRELKCRPNMRPLKVSVQAVALSGSLLALLRWWIDGGQKESPSEMDRVFHHLVWNGLQ